jgi:pimeloyl-ACP methyl ester carboxylesterase
MLVLLPGWAGFRSSLLPFAWSLRRRLGRDVFRPRVGLGIGCIRRSAELAAAEIDAIARANRGLRFDLIGHSMGGLVAAYVLKRLDAGRHVRTVITLGTPHRGSPAVLMGRGVVARLSESVAQMSPRSEFLTELASAPVPERSQIVSIASENDGIVPALYAQLPRRPRQHNRTVRECGHLGLLYSRDVHDAIERILRATPRKPARKPAFFAPAPRPAVAAM